MKRLFDIIVSIVCLVVLGPLLAAISLAIIMTSGKPAIFIQTRVGRGKGFILLKFRTMKIQPGAEAGAFEPGSMARTTSVGRVLRATKLDELPQLWNVLKGDMSLVGPRPEVPAWVAAYPERWEHVLSIRPGITDPASLAYRNEESILARYPNPETAYRETVLPKKLGLYEEYLQKHTLAGDIRIIVETMGKLMSDLLKRK